MAKSPLPLLLGGAAALFLLKGKKGTEAKPAPSPDVGGGAPPVTEDPAAKQAGSSGYKEVSIAQMKIIQNQLATLGFDPGKIDGKWVFGGSTYEAVKGFQNAHGLTADGKPGPITQAKLNELTKTGSSEGSSAPTKTYTDAELSAVPALPNTNSVVFSAKLNDFEIGPVWRFQTLEPWLNQLRTSGWLATREDEAYAYQESDIKNTVDYWTQQAAGAITGAAFAAGTGVTLAYGVAFVASVSSLPMLALAGATAMAAGAALGEEGIEMWGDAQRQMYIRQTGAWALNRFVQTQTVLVGPELIPTKISHLKRTPAMEEFLSIVASNIARFQGYNFDE